MVRLDQQMDPSADILIRTGRNQLDAVTGMAQTLQMVLKMDDLAMQHAEGLVGLEPILHLSQRDRHYRLVARNQLAILDDMVTQFRNCAHSTPLFKMF